MVWVIIKKWKYPILAVLALVFLISVADPFVSSILHSSQERKREQRRTAPRWQWFTNRDSGYVVEFPSRPFENPYTLSNTQNVISYRQFASTLGSNNAFMVATLVTSVTNTFTDDEIKLLLKGLLAKNQKLRLGSLKGIREILFHPWLGRVNSEQILNKQLQPPYVPDINEFNFDENELGDDEP